MLAVVAVELTVEVLPVLPHLVVVQVAQQLLDLLELLIPVEEVEVEVALQLRQAVTVDLV
jgi:hypothetical protein